MNQTILDFSSQIARDDLAKMRNVKLMGGPLDSAGYQQLVDDADIILLPYIGPAYRYRTSNVFIEALAAAKPVIYPKDSWMGYFYHARQYHYHKNLAGNALRKADLMDGRISIALRDGEMAVMLVTAKAAAPAFRQEIVLSVSRNGESALVRHAICMHFSAACAADSAVFDFGQGDYQISISVSGDYNPAIYVVKSAKKYFGAIPFDSINEVVPSLLEIEEHYLLYREDMSHVSRSVQESQSVALIANELLATKMAYAS